MLRRKSVKPFQIDVLKNTLSGKYQPGEIIVATIKSSTTKSFSPQPLFRHVLRERNSRRRRTTQIKM